MLLVKANYCLFSYSVFLGNKTLKLKKKHSTDGDHIIIINIQIKIITVKHTHLRKLAQAKNLLNKTKGRIREDEYLLKISKNIRVTVSKTDIESILQK